MRFLTLSFALLAAPAFAQDASDAHVAAMVAAIEDAGCSVTAENGDAVLEASGLSEDETMAVIQTLYTDGMVALEADGSLSLNSEACQ